MSARDFQVEIVWRQTIARNKETQFTRAKSITARAQARSIRRAINKALLAFFTDKSQRKVRAEAHAHIQVTATREPCRSRSTK
jgi:hypothetical protein